jgi:hypothetical protein
MQTHIVLHKELRIKFWLSAGEGERAICLPRAVVKPGLICLSANAIRRWCISRRLFSSPHLPACARDTQIRLSLFLGIDSAPCCVCLERLFAVFPSQVVSVCVVLCLPVAAYRFSMHTHKAPEREGRGRKVNKI